MLTLSSSVVKSDSELRTLGDLANRNRDRLADQKADLVVAYSVPDDKVKDELTKELPRNVKNSKTKYNLNGDDMAFFQQQDNIYREANISDEDLTSVLYFVWSRR